MTLCKKIAYKRQSHQELNNEECFNQEGVGDRDDPNTYRAPADYHT